MLNDILRNAGSDTLKYVPVRLVPAFTSLITVPVFTHMIGKAEYGDFYLISSATSLTATLATAWITSSAVRFFWVYEKQDRVDDYMATTTWATLTSITLVSAIIGLAVFLLRDFIPSGVLRLVPLGLASLAFNYFVTVLLQVFRAANKANEYLVLSVLSTLASTAFSVYFVWSLEWGALGILGGVVVGNLLVIPWGLKVARRQGRLSPRFFKKDVLGEYMRFGFPLIPASISSWILVLADRYVIAALRDSGEVGLYSVTYGLGEKLMQLVTLPLIIAIAPVLIHTFEKQGQALAQKVQTQLTRYFAIATFPLLFGMAAVSKNFVQVFTDAEYHVGYPILPIVGTGVLCYGFVQIAANGVTLHKRSSIIMTNTLTAAAFNVIANIIFVSRYGYMAAAYTTVVSYALLLGLTWWRSRPYMAWQIPWFELGRVTLASGTMALVLVGLFWRLPSSLGLLLLEVVVGLSIYIVMLLLLHGIREDEKEFAKEIAGKVAVKLHLKKA